MKIVQINATCGSGSIGKICQDVSKMLNDKGIENYVLYSMGNSSYPYSIKFCNEYVRKIQSLIEKVLGIYGFGAKLTTKLLIQKLKHISPNIIHIHNIHTHDVDLGMLFEYLNSNNIKVFWTFHDCWAFTGYCPYFDMADCYKWKTGCHRCKVYKQYSFIFDRSEYLYNQKRRALEKSNCTVITPSKWLAELVGQSFLKDKAIKVINNGIDLDIFRPRKSNFRLKYHCDNKIILLGIANIWEKRKGLDTFIRLAKDLNDNYQIVLVGTNNEINKLLPRNVISIHRTENQKQLAEIYSAADLFVIPTLEENFPTVNIESLACGTPVVTYNTGGSPEIIDDKTGYVVQDNKYDKLLEIILHYNREFKALDCIQRAKMFDKFNKYNEYLKLYTDV